MLYKALFIALSIMYIHTSDSNFKSIASLSRKNCIIKDDKKKLHNIYLDKFDILNININSINNINLNSHTSRLYEAENQEVFITQGAMNEFFNIHKNNKKIYYIITYHDKVTINTEYINHNFAKTYIKKNITNIESFDINSELNKKSQQNDSIYTEQCTYDDNEYNNNVKSTQNNIVLLNNQQRKKTLQQFTTQYKDFNYMALVSFGNNTQTDYLNYAELDTIINNKNNKNIITITLYQRIINNNNFNLKKSQDLTRYIQHNHDIYKNNMQNNMQNLDYIECNDNNDEKTFVVGYNYACSLPISFKDKYILYKYDLAVVAVNNFAININTMKNNIITLLQKYKLNINEITQYIDNIQSQNNCFKKSLIVYIIKYQVSSGDVVSICNIKITEYNEQTIGLIFSQNIIKTGQKISKWQKCQNVIDKVFCNTFKSYKLEKFCITTLHPALSNNLVTATTVSLFVIPNLDSDCAKKTINYNNIYISLHNMIGIFNFSESVRYFANNNPYISAALAIISIIGVYYYIVNFLLGVTINLDKVDNQLNDIDDQLDNVENNQIQDLLLQCFNNCFNTCESQIDGEVDNNGVFYTCELNCREDCDNNI